MLGSGAVVSNRYRLEEHLATGGMGEVWRARDLALGRTVAVKVLLRSLVRDPDFAARFRAEARMMAALRHPGVVDVYDCGEDDLSDGEHVLYLVMEYVEGEPLSRRIATAGRLDLPEAMSVVAQAARALHAAHGSGIVHRDVKPSNLLVQPNGTVKLVDFGVARSAAVTSVTGTNAIVGTALYMAPEQARGRPVSAATDIYALGAVAYHCLSGHPPFPGDNPLEVAVRHLHDTPPPLPADVPAPARALVERALAKEPADRYPSAAALARDARAILAGRGDTVTLAAAAAGAAVPAADQTRTLAADAVGAPVAARPTAARGRGRRRTAVSVAGGALLALAGLTAVLAFTPDANAPTRQGPATPAPSAPTAKQVRMPGGDTPQTSGERAGSGSSAGATASPTSAPTRRPAGGGAAPTTAPTTDPAPTPDPTTPPGSEPQPTGSPDSPPPSPADGQAQPVATTNPTARPGTAAAEG
ncbi:serine/threonine protein kinase [Micromonospora pattaloongensis]|uniref:non-specific serine/threonine protein kinase n=1 Tax=Micromonospora pattaloongensis TaxID=405436 RepID=A0A1H3NT27_9ACTN|nr:serine/threonine-protein kinase [Micromonospora pattaloongensis]SDY91329.1 serine/threonine protein kinase [Micromonospora pattaloongensis]